MKRPVKISVHIEEEVWQAFKSYVLAKYGCLWRYLGEELSYALEYYLTHATSAHTQEIEHKFSKPNKRHIQLLIWLAQNFKTEVTYSDIESFIIQNIGSDKRTKKKYINDFLVKLGFIEVKKGLYGKNILYKVNYEKIHAFLRKFMKEEELDKLGIAQLSESESEGINSTENAKETYLEEAKAYAVQRYEAGDSLEEIVDKLEDFGLSLTKKSVRNFIRKALREVRF